MVCLSCGILTANGGLWHLNKANLKKTLDNRSHDEELFGTGASEATLRRRFCKSVIKVYDHN
jgi:hypothetical protein